MIKNFPTPLKQKIWFTLSIGAGCLVLGTAYCFATDDSVFMVLSAIIFVATLLKALNFYIIALKQRYETVTGICTEIIPVVFGRFIRVKIIDDVGTETTLNLQKGCRLRIGQRYAFYFTKNIKKPLEGEFLNTMLATDCFLGYEKIS